MDFFFPEDNLTRAVPEETRIQSISAESWPDGRRIRVNIQATPFQQRPHIEVTLKNADGEEVASTSFVEPLSWKIEFTMHIRGEMRNPFTLTARLYYPDGPTDQPHEITFDVTPPATPEPDSD
ncbi:MAG: hypothetical protein JNK32_04405 [Anaerolineales bacterium]|nr:hypothetical protein [Anaerolineales bacterium]